MSLDGSFSPSPKEWNILKLTQSWPPAVCIFVETEVGVDIVMGICQHCHCALHV